MAALQVRSSGARLGETVTQGVASALSCHGMRFGLFYQAPEATGQTHADRYAEMFDLIALGDSLGFDVAWLAELHFGGAFSLLASPLMAGPVVAPAAPRLSLGAPPTAPAFPPPPSPGRPGPTARLLPGGRPGVRRRPW